MNKTIIKILKPSTISKTYSLSKIPSTKGLAFETSKEQQRMKTTICLDKTLKTKPFEEHLIKDNIVKARYIRSNN